MTARVHVGYGILVSSILGCDAGARTPAPPLVRDSASITIVENAEPALGDGPSWTLSSEPVLSIGVTEGQDEYQFHQVMGVVRFEDGRVAVAEMGSNRLRMYDAEGRHLWSAGGPGEGPGEITQTFGLFRIGSDTLAVPDTRGPVHFFSAEGEYVGGFAFSTEGRARALPIGVLEDGSLLFAPSLPVPMQISEPTELTLAIYRTRVSTGRSDSIATLLSGVVHPGALGATTEVFGPALRTATVADGFYAGYSDQFELRKLDPTGRVVLIVRRRWTPTPVTSELVEEYGERSVRREGEDAAAYARLWDQRRRIVESSPVATTLPAFTAVHADRLGNLWVREAVPEHFYPARGGFKPIFSTPSRWSILDPGGTWLGMVETPANFHVFEIGGDYVAGVSHDDLGVERVVVYDLTKEQ